MSVGDSRKRFERGFATLNKRITHIIYIRWLSILGVGLIVEIAHFWIIL